MLDTDAAQGAFEMVHAKTFVPRANPVIDVVGDNELVIEPNPETSVHTPVPTVGVFAAINVFGLVIQSVWLGPARAIDGTLLTVIVMLLTEATQGALETVQAKTLLPTAKPVIVVLGNTEFVITPLPETNVQAPDPTAGKLAAMLAVGLEIHNV